VSDNVAYSGAKLTIEFAKLMDGTIPGLQFLREQDARHQAQIHVLFKRLGDEGKISNREKFKRIEGTEGLWEFKAFQIRMPCYFRSGQRVVITHGFLKKSDRIRRSDLARAESIKSQYEALLRHGTREERRQ
jgi:hypothetical protein